MFVDLQPGAGEVGRSLTLPEQGGDTHLANASNVLGCTFKYKPVKGAPDSHSFQSSISREIPGHG